MQFGTFSLLLFAAVWFPICPCVAGGGPEWQLGEAPSAPADVSRLPRSVERRSITGPFTVNTDSREQVRSFYNAVYRASDGVAMDSTADVLSCTPGTNSTAYREAVLRRINWFRAMAGVPAAVTFDDTFSRKAQQAALMMSRNNALSHFPPTTWGCYTAEGAEGAGSSNLALGSAGSEALTGYIHDPGANNAAVGHRRWILYPQTQLMGSGDVPARSTNLPANATWVFDGHYSDPRPPTRRPFVSWPPAGYVPAPVVFPRWSLSFPNANFTNATVMMRSNGVPVSVVREMPLPNIGENTVVWVPAGLNANDYGTVWPFSGADTVYTVGVSNVVVGGFVSNFNYTVTVFDPAVPGADYFPPTISGTNQPAVGLSNTYTFTAVSNATGYQWRHTQRRPYSLSDGAENGLTNFLLTTSPGYAVRQSSVKASGAYAFHLATPDGEDQTLLLNRVLYPGAGGQVTFKSRLGWATTEQWATVQVSTNGGLSWQDIYSQVGSGSAGETVFATRAASLAAVAGRAVRLRFHYHVERAGSYYPQTDPGVGWYLDDLVVTNVEELLPPVTNATATTNFVFTPPEAGNFNLDVRALIFSEFPLDWGPVKAVTAVTSAAPAVVLVRAPSLNGSQVRIDFALQSGTASGFTLLRAEFVTGPWTPDPGAVLSTNGPGSYRFTTSTGGAGRRFYVVRVP